MSGPLSISMRASASCRSSAGRQRKPAGECSRISERHPMSSYYAEELAWKSENDSKIISSLEASSFTMSIFLFAPHFQYIHNVCIY